MVVLLFFVRISTVKYIPEIYSCNMKLFYCLINLNFSNKMVCDFNEMGFLITVLKIELRKELGKYKLLLN